MDVSEAPGTDESAPEAAGQPTTRVRHNQPKNRVAVGGGVGVDAVAGAVVDEAVDAVISSRQRWRWWRHRRKQRWRHRRKQRWRHRRKESWATKVETSVAAAAETMAETSATEALTETLMESSGEPSAESSVETSVEASVEISRAAVEAVVGMAPTTPPEKQDRGAPRSCIPPKLQWNHLASAQGQVADRGLCDASAPNSLKLNDKVGFKRSELPGLKYYFDKNYMFNPASIEVVVGSTRVKIDGRIFVVESFDHGKYNLAGHKPITQWELLQNRRGEGATLDDELRRFIIQQADDYVVMMARAVPYFHNCGIATEGMLWNIKEAVERARAHPDNIDVESNKMTLEELASLQEGHEKMRSLSLEIFTTLPLSETLPKNFWGGAVDGSLRDFAEGSGSLSQLNCLKGLGCASRKGMTEGCLFTEDVVGGGHSIAPSHDRPRGTWDEKLKSVSRLLTCAYRLGRPVSLVEAYIPLSEGECNILDAHHGQWKDNLAFSLKGLHVGLEESVDVNDSELTGEKSNALRAGPGILQKLLGTDSSTVAVERIVSVKVENFFQKVRNNRAHIEAKTSGGVRMFMEALDVNGCRRIMEAIERIDPGIIDFLLERLGRAERASTTWDSNAIGGDHLFGTTPDEVAEGKRRVDALVDALEVEGITSKDFVVFMIRLPDEGKQTRKAEKKESAVCMEHEVEGEDVVRWMAVMALVGRRFLEKANGGEELSKYFTALGVGGQALSQGVFGTILTGVGGAFFGLENLDLNGFRTAQDTLAVEMILELGWSLDDQALKNLAKQQRTSLEATGQITQAEREGLQEMVTAIGDAFRRAKARGSKDPVYHYMTLPRNQASLWSLVRKLRKLDAVDYRPGAWFKGSGFAKMTDGKPIEKLIMRVEDQVPDFKWTSWQSFGK
ncbi:unnamed protein product [Ectocarpus sp. CCAP 1310/34]|nr:unnamed protein product [Ectocarpus sp. CCAP 1310/34]